MPERIEDPVRSIKTTICLNSKDYGLHHRDAWIYGIIVGWDDESLLELTTKFRWTKQTVIRLLRLRQRFLEVEEYAKARWSQDGRE